MRRVSNEVLWAGIAAIVCGVIIASFLGGTKTPWWLVLATIAAGLVVTIVRSRRAARDRYGPYAAPPEARVEAAEDAPRAKREVETAKRPPRLGAPDAASLRRAGARSESLGTGPRPPRKDNSAR